MNPRARNVMGRHTGRRSVIIGLVVLLLAGLLSVVSGPAFASSGYLNPLRGAAGLGPRRIDGGVDYVASGGSPLYALGDGSVLEVYNTGWPNGVFIEYQLNNGPAQGKCVYAAEDLAPAVHVGDAVSAGTVVGTFVAGADNGHDIEIGWADCTNLGNSLGTYQQGSDQNRESAYGLNFSDLLASLGAPPGTPNGAVYGTLPAGWPQWSGGSASTGYLTAFQTNTGALALYGQGGIKTTLGMKAGTDPAITSLPNGGHESAFQANTGILYTYGDAGNVDTKQGMMAGTDPAIAANSSGYEVAFQSNVGNLMLWTPAGGSVNTGQGMKAGTSPSIAAVPGGGFLVAFQANTGELLVWGKGHTYQGMMAGTSPSIAATSTGYEVAFQANTGILTLWKSAGGSVNTGQGMRGGTNPSLAVDQSGNYHVAFEANTNELLVWGDGHTKQGMMAGTSPSIATTSTGYEVAFQSNTGELVLWTSGGGALHTAQGPMSGTSPAITG